MAISILITSDLHGRLDRFEQLAKQMKALTPDLVIDNGDFLDGSPSSFYFKHINKQPHPMIDLANDLYDVAVFGNHEFHTSLPTLQSLRLQFHFPWISCNIGDFAKPYFTKTLNGKKFVVVGATTHFTPIWDERGFVDNLSFEDALQAIRYWVDEVRTNENPDYLIVSYHGGFSEDPLTGAKFQERIGENQANEILEAISDIDLLITGHQHLYFNEMLDCTLIIQPTSHGNGFFEVEVDFEQGQSKAKFHPLGNRELLYPPEVEKWLDEKITQINGDYTYQGLLSSRLTSHPYIELFHDMQLKMTNAQISVCDLLYLENGGFKGTVTNRDLLKNSPREHKLKVISLSGKEIKELMEQSAAVFALNNNREIDFSTNVFPDIPQPYQYDFWGGVCYIIDVKEPVGRRVKDVTFEGEALEDSRNYRVVLNSYRLTGYDFPLLKNRQILYESAKTIPFLLRDYLKFNFPSEAPNHGFFKVIR